MKQNILQHIPQKTAMTKLILVKIIHTAIWAFFNVIIFYLFYAVICNKIDKFVWICIGMIIGEGVILMAFKGKCPLTIIAGYYTTSTKDNFDIFLPNWLAKYNKFIYTTLFAIVIVLLIWRVINT